MFPDKASKIMFGFAMSCFVLSFIIHVIKTVALNGGR